MLPFGATLAGLWLARWSPSLILGFADPRAYARAPGLYMGAVIGRTANRTAFGTTTLEGSRLSLPINAPPHHSAGGFEGFSTRVWSVEERRSDRVTLRLDSPDGDQGYPGAVTVRATYAIVAPATLCLTFEATTSRTTLLGLCHHPYFNLGPGKDVFDHRLQIAAERYLPCDETILPTGEIASVTGTPFDFRQPRPLDAVLSPGVRHNNTLVLHTNPVGPLKDAATLSAPGAPTLRLATTQPGLHVYSAYKLRSAEAERSARPLAPFAAICLEAQAWPDSANRTGFPSLICRPDEPYFQRTEYAFSVD